MSETSAEGKAESKAASELLELVQKHREVISETNKNIIELASTKSPAELIKVAVVAIKALIAQHETVLEAAKGYTIKEMICKSGSPDPTDEQIEEANKDIGSLTSFAIDNHVLGVVLKTLLEMDMDFPTPPEEHIKRVVNQAFARFMDTLEAGRVNGISAKFM